MVVQEERCRTMCPGYEDGLDGAVSIGLPVLLMLGLRGFQRFRGSHGGLPFGKRLQNYGKSQKMDLHIKIVIFHSYAILPEGNHGSPELFPA